MVSPASSVMQGAAIANSFVIRAVRDQIALPAVSEGAGCRRRIVAACIQTGAAPGIA